MPHKFSKRFYEVESKDKHSIVEFNGVKADGGRIKYAAEFERDYYLLLEYDENTKLYWKPNLAVAVQHGGCETAVEIHLWVEQVDGKANLLHFVPDTNEGVNAAWHWQQHHLFEAVKKACSRDNLRFIVINESTVASLVLTANLKKLWENAYQPITVGHWLAVENYLRNDLFPTVGGLHREFEYYRLNSAAVDTMIFHRLLNAGIETFEFNDETSIARGNSDFVYLPKSSYHPKA